MKEPVLVDTGPIVAYLVSAEEHHEWAVSQFSRFGAGALLCEPVITEVCFLVARLGRSPDPFLAKIQSGVFRVGLRLEDEMPAVRSLLSKYSEHPMSLADACMVRMSELFDGHPVVTLDSDFRFYRKHRRQTIPLIAP